MTSQVHRANYSMMDFPTLDTSKNSTDNAVSSSNPNSFIISANNNNNNMAASQTHNPAAEFDMSIFNNNSASSETPINSDAPTSATPSAEASISTRPSKPSASPSSSTKTGKKQKNVPVEYTAQGTTPSGKPRLFVCQVCTRAFARLEHLRRHERSHTKEKPFSCGVCQRKFSRRDLLLRHAQKLHAGCTDAITRLRKKSIKRSGSNTSYNDDLFENESLGKPEDDDADEVDDEGDDDDVDTKAKRKSTPRSSKSTRVRQSSIKKTFDPVQFNLNLFNQNNPTPSKVSKLSRRNSLKEPSSSTTSTPPQPFQGTPAPGAGSSLQRQVFDRRRIGRGRGASFSAQSGANYASGNIPELNDSYPGAENVEFSTPQLLPSTINDENSWLNNLSSIPGMSSLASDDNSSPYSIMQDAILQRQQQQQQQQNHASPNAQTLRSNSIMSFENGQHVPDVPHNVSHSGSFSGKLPSSATPDNNSMMRSDSLMSNGSGYMNFDSFNAASQYMMPTATISHNEINHAAAHLSNRTGGGNNHNNNSTAGTLDNTTNNNGIRNPSIDENGEYGYSFYDIPDTLLLNKFNDPIKFPQPLTPIKQELDEEDLMELVNDANSGHGGIADLSQQRKQQNNHIINDKIPVQDLHQSQQHQPAQLLNGSSNAADSITTNGVNFDLDFLYDIDELTHEFDVGSKFAGGGYSFYGDNPSVSSSGIESSNGTPHINSPPGTHNSRSRSQSQAQATAASHAAPGLASSHSYNSQNGVSDKNYLSQSQLQSIDTSNEVSKKKHSIKSDRFTRNRLFTSNMRHMINKSLSKYPISGIMTPTIPSNEKLEFYLTQFNAIFLSHFPFIHASKLNEYEIMNMTSNEDASNESSRACLPLLVATIGALLANNKNDSEHLYEASRRIIHIYLESRKNFVHDSSNDGEANNQSVNPLWLIQSLTLSVVYGLFSDNENNVYIVIRQLNALNSLVKTSIISKRTILFSIYGDDEKTYKNLQQSSSSNQNSLFGNSNAANDELKYKNNINIQSQRRIVFMIYRLTNFLLMMYNVPLTLSINDLGNLCVPSTNDEFLWNFKNFQSFQEYTQLQNGAEAKNLDYYLTKTKDNEIVYKEVLIQLTKAQIHKGTPQDPALYSKLANLSKYGFISVLHGLFEIKQYEEMRSVDIFSILDDLSRFIDNSVTRSTPVQMNTTGLLNNSQQDDFEKLDYALLLNFIKINSLVDFKLVKEQSWLRNFDELTKNYDWFLTSLENVNEFDLLRLIDCCIIIVKLVLFKTDDADTSNANSSNNTAKSPTMSRGTGKELFHTELNYFNTHHPSFNVLVDDSLRNRFSASSTFEQSINLKVFDEIDNSKNSIHSQMLFHVFTILSIFAIFVIKKNNPDGLHGNGSRVPESNLSSSLNELNQRYVTILKLLGKIENFLKIKYQNSKLENDFTNLCLFSNSANDDLYANPNKEPISREQILREAAANNCFNYSLERSLYILKLGESIMSYMYDTNIKVSIFKKLSDSLSQIRRFLIDNESRILS